MAVVMGWWKVGGLELKLSVKAGRVLEQCNSLGWLPEYQIGIENYSLGLITSDLKWKQGSRIQEKRKEKPQLLKLLTISHSPITDLSPQCRPLWLPQLATSSPHPASTLSMTSKSAFMV